MTKKQKGGSINRKLVYDSPRRSVTSRNSEISHAHTQVSKRRSAKSQQQWLKKHAKPVVKNLSEYEKHEYCFIQGHTNRTDLFETQSECVKRQKNLKWAQSMYIVLH